jgi:hypothetical protein
VEELDGQLDTLVPSEPFACHDIEAVERALIVVGHFAEGRHFVAQLLQVGRQLLDLVPRSAVVRFRTVAGGHQSREQRGPAGRAGRRGHKCL